MRDTGYNHKESDQWPVVQRKRGIGSMMERIPPTTESTLTYPESDGQPIAENTESFRWLVMIKENLEALFYEQTDVFVAGDLFWYPVEGQPDIRRAPDIMVVFGRPKGPRGSYLQWQEADIAPQVVFEIFSPSNTLTEMMEKLEFYEQYGVEEYYIYDPQRAELTGMLREDDKLRVYTPLNGWSSPRLGIRFDLSADELCIFAPNGQPFLSFSEVAQQRDSERTARQQAEQQRDSERIARQQAEQRAEALATRLRERGIDPEAADPS